jgi:hypothetical protein
VLEIKLNEPNLNIQYSTRLEYSPNCSILPLSHHALIIRIHTVIKCSYYPLSAYEVIEVLGTELVIHSSSKYKNAFYIVERYYSDHTC